jgi:hypothetical protein
MRCISVIRLLLLLLLLCRKRITTPNYAKTKLNKPLLPQNLLNKNHEYSVMSGFHRYVIRYALFCVMMQRLVVILYRRLGTTYRSHLQRLRSPRIKGKWDRDIVPKRR